MPDAAVPAPRIHYSQCWEDVAVAREALRIPAGGRVLAIGAAGDNVLALLLDDPAAIVAVDNNPAQTALLELKRAAFQRLAADGVTARGVAAHGLAPDRVAAFLGAATDPGRLATYEALRPSLPPEAARFWDGRPAELAGGVIHAGRFERYLAAFRRFVLPLAPGRDVVAAMLTASGVAEQERLYRARWDTWRWRAFGRIFFSRRLLAAFGRHPRAFDHAGSRGVAEHFLERARAGLTATPLARNPYATYILTGGFRSPDAVPDHLHPAAVEAIAGRVGRIEARTQSLLDALARAPDRSIDAFYLSDVFELFSGDEYEHALAEITRTGRPGARVCYWNNLVERRRPAALAGELDSHDELAAGLHRRDRAFLYSRLVVESVRPRPGRSGHPGRAAPAVRAAAPASERTPTPALTNATAANAD